MSQNISILAEPADDDRISERVLGYVGEGARDDMFDMVLRNCVESGVSKATLARRLGKDPSQITRLLGAPGNWTIDTVAELLFAIDGRILVVDSCWPLRETPSNQRFAHWLHDDVVHIKLTTAPTGTNKSANVSLPISPFATANTQTLQVGWHK